MLDVKRVVEIINKLGYKTFTFNYNVYSQYIMQCYNWYQGEVPNFHTVKQYNGKYDVVVKKARLNMAKRVCEDLASLTFNENVEIGIEDKDTHDYLLGFDEMTGILGQNNFWAIGSKLYELTAALGTGAYEIVVENLLEYGDKITSYKDTKIKLVTHNALEIIPLSWDNNGEIKEVAFIDQYVIKNDTFCDMRIHILGDDGNYLIVNKRLKVLGNTSKEINKYVYEDRDDVLSEFNTKSNIPWFSILKLPVVNNYDIKSPMGASVYANAVDILKNIDDAFNTLSTEYRYGNKKVFYNKSLLNRDASGNIIVPDDDNKATFYYTGDDFSEAEVKDPIREFNPTLRIDEISKGIESSLNYLSVMCGLGNSFYKFTGGSVQKTATEVLSENSGVYRNIRKNQLEVEKFLHQIFKGLLYVSNFVFKTSFNIDTEISIHFDASIIEDKGAERQRDLQEVELGIISIEEYRAKWVDVDSRSKKPVKA